MEGLAFLPVIEREVALTRQADDHLLEIVVGVATADGVLLGTPNVINSSYVELEIYALFKSYEITGMIAMDHEIL